MKFPGLNSAATGLSGLPSEGTLVWPGVVEADPFAEVVEGPNVAGTNDPEPDLCPNTNGFAFGFNVGPCTEFGGGGIVGCGAASGAFVVKLNICSEVRREWASAGSCTENWAVSGREEGKGGRGRPTVIPLETDNGR